MKQQFIKIRLSARTGGAVRGIVLPAVLVIIMLLGMLAIGFSFSTRAENMTLHARSDINQAHLSAVSGIEAAALLLRQRFEDHYLWYDNSQIFHNQSVDMETTQNRPIDTWRFSLVGYNLDSQDVVRFGLTDEASKVNINVASEDQLLRLPGMTPELAASLLDWRESRETPRDGGAKDEYYLSLTQPYRCKKAPLDTIEELLLIKGFDGTVVFGEDMNRNGLLDPNENDGRKSLPIDNADGILDRGLYPFITVYSREPEVADSDPYQPRINIQQWPAEILSAMLEDKLRQEVIDFIMTAKRANMNFGPSPASLLEMEFEADGQTHASPVTLDDMDDIMDFLTTGYQLNEDGFVYGRINVNTAPRTVLSTIGWLTEEEVDAIIATRTRLDPVATRTIAWLVTQDVLPVEKFKEVACLFTARSYQFMIESIGYKNYEGYQARIQAVVELRLPRVQFIYWRDLSSLGRAYNFGDYGETDIVIQQ